MKAFAILSSLLVLLGFSSPANAEEWTPLTAVKTDQGCLFYVYATRSHWVGQKNTAKWVGAPCRKGQFINGQGTMYHNDKYENIYDQTGTLIDGAWHGTVTTFSEHAHPNTYTFELVMGCTEYFIRKKECTPHKPSFATSTNGDGSNSSVSVSASEATVAARNEAARLANSGPGGSSVPPLRPTPALEAHNPANEASQCLELITQPDFERRRVTSSVTGAAFRNSCPYPIETRWCIGADRCARLGYDNLATMPASKDRAISYDAPAGVRTETRWAGCRFGFANRGDLAGTLQYACK